MLGVNVCWPLTQVGSLTCFAPTWSHEANPKAAESDRLSSPLRLTVSRSDVCLRSGTQQKVLFSSLHELRHSAGLLHRHASVPHSHSSDEKIRPEALLEEETRRRLTVFPATLG